MGNLSDLHGFFIILLLPFIKLFCCSDKIPEGSNVKEV
jgi:hypothetical protein